MHELRLCLNFIYWLLWRDFFQMGRSLSINKSSFLTATMLPEWLASLTLNLSSGKLYITLFTRDESVDWRLCFEWILLLFSGTSAQASCLRARNCAMQKQLLSPSILPTGARLRWLTSHNWWSSEWNKTTRSASSTPCKYFYVWSLHFLTTSTSSAMWRYNNVTLMFVSIEGVTYRKYRMFFTYICQDLACIVPTCHFVTL